MSSERKFVSVRSRSSLGFNDLARVSTRGFDRQIDGERATGTGGVGSAAKPPVSLRTGIRRESGALGPSPSMVLDAALQLHDAQMQQKHEIPQATSPNQTQPAPLVHPTTHASSQQSQAPNQQQQSHSGNVIAKTGSVTELVDREDEALPVISFAQIDDDRVDASEMSLHNSKSVRSPKRSVQSEASKVLFRSRRASSGVGVFAESNSSSAAEFGSTGAAALAASAGKSGPLRSDSKLGAKLKSLLASKASKSSSSGGGQ